MGTCVRLFYTNSRAFLCPREYLLTSSRSYSGKSLSQLERVVFPDKPKKPPTSFFLYVQDKSSRLKDDEQKSLNRREYVTRLSTEWKQLDELQKEVYKNKYRELYDEYSKALIEFESSKTTEQIERLKLLQKEYTSQKNRKDKLDEKKMYEEGKPKAPPPLLVYYMKSSMPSGIRGRMSKDWLYRISEEWNGLSSEVRADYVAEYQELRRDYKARLDAWKEQREISGKKDLNKNTLDGQDKGGETLSGKCPDGAIKDK